MSPDTSPLESQDWSPRLHEIGAIVEDDDDIAQCIGIILTTPKGSDPHRPQFGADLWRWIDRPAMDALPHLVREAIEAIRLWEPRAEIIKITPRIMANSAQAPGHWQIIVEWRLRTDNRPRTTEIIL